jgi:disulfide bond formation protein DsbB
MPVALIDKGLAVLALGGQAAVAALVLAFALRRQSDLAAALIQWVSRHALTLVFLVSAGATAVSLFYSEVIGYPPCPLCWYQRVFMYPIALISGLALGKRDERVADYLLALSGVGLLIALYHTSLQFGAASILPCPTSAVSCAQQFVMEFGYITIPVMSLTAFGLMAALLLAQRSARA